MKAIVLATCLAGFALSVPATAGTLVVGGTVDAGPTFNRPLSGTPPTVLSAVGTSVYYDTYSFIVTAAGSYSLAHDSLVYDPFLVLYAGSFDPTQPLLNAISADDDGGVGFNSLINSNLLVGTTYIAVLTTFGNGETGAYTLTIDGPGDILPPGVNPGVPEPATWAMLIAGFGLVGSTMRRRRTDVVTN